VSPAIRIRNVSHRFGEAGEARNVRALLDSSLDVARGELLCLIGPQEHAAQHRRRAAGAEHG
jgi:ABC-type multidrug transport system ATPase subunit